MRSRTFTNHWARAQPYFYTVDLIKFGRETSQEKKNEGEQFSDNRNWARLHQRLIIREKKKGIKILWHLIPEEVSFLGTCYISNKATLFGSWTSQVSLFEEKQQLLSDLPATKIHLRNLHEQKNISDDLFSDKFSSPWMVPNAAHF